MTQPQPPGDTPSTSAAPGRAFWLFSLLVLLPAGLAVRIPRMTQSIWYDEYCRTHGWLNADNLRNILFHDVHNPLYNAFMFLWINVLGDSEISIRLPSLLAYIATIAIFAGWVGVRIGKEQALVVAAWMWLAPMGVWYSTEAKNNAFVLLTATAAFVAVDALRRSPHLRGVALAAVAITFAVYTSFLTTLIAIPASLGVVLGAEASGRWRSARSVAAAWLLAAAACAPLLLFKHAHTDDLWRDYPGPFTANAALTFFGGYLPEGRAIFPSEPQRSYLLYSLGLVFVMGTLVGFMRALRYAPWRALALALVFPPLVMALWTAWATHAHPDGGRWIYQPRNLLIILPMFAAAIALAIDLVPGPRLRAALAAVFIAVALLGSVFMVTIHADRWTVMRPNPDWRSAAAAIRDDAGGGRAIAVAKSLAYALEYYEDSIDLRSTWQAPIRPEMLRNIASRNPRTPLYLVDHSHWAPLTPDELHRINTVARLEHLFTTDYITIYRLRMLDAPGAD